jgi:hypothetical protein
MNNFMAFLRSKQVKRFLWTTLAGTLGLFIVYLQQPEIAEVWYAPFLISLIQGITKELNTKYGKANQ